MIVLGVIAVLVILIGFALATSSIANEESINEPEVKVDTKPVLETEKPKVVVEDFKDALPNEHFVKKIEKQSEPYITEHIKSVIDEASKSTKKGKTRQRTRAVKK